VKSKPTGNDLTWVTRTIYDALQLACPIHLNGPASAAFSEAFLRGTRREFDLTVDNIVAAAVCERSGLDGY